jgi:hypothetical protein
MGGVDRGRRGAALARRWQNTLLSGSRRDDDASFEAGTPVALLSTRTVDGGIATTRRPQCAVARVGRFLINQPVADATAAPITLILNWNPEMKK